MPKYTEDWEAEYFDPESIAADARDAAYAARLNQMIWAEIALCEKEIEDEEFAQRQRDQEEKEANNEYNL